MLMRICLFIVVVMGIVLFLAADVASASTATLDELVEVDLPGHKCLPASTFDLIYPEDDNVTPLDVGGKGVILPPICMPQPCEEALTPELAAAFFGYLPTGKEWDDLYAAYAEHCRTETVAFSEPEPRAPWPYFGGGGAAVMASSGGGSGAKANSNSNSGSNSSSDSFSTSFSFGGSSFSVSVGDIFGGDTYVEKNWKKIIKKEILIAYCSIVNSPKSKLFCGDIDIDIDIDVEVECVTCKMAAIPLPAGVWLLISALGGLYGWRKIT